MSDRDPCSGELSDAVEAFTRRGTDNRKRPRPPPARMARSILGTVGLALTLAFAIPVAYLGVEFLLDGKTNQGLLFLGIAVLMVGIQEYVTTPMDLPGEIAGKVLGKAVKEPGESDDGTGPDVERNGAETGTAGGAETGGGGQDSDGADEEVLIPDADADRSN